MKDSKPAKKDFLSRMAGLDQSEGYDDIYDDIETMALRTAIAELELLKRSGLSVTFH